MHGLLSILIWLPIAAGVLVLLLGERNIVAGRWLALLASLATLIISLPLLADQSLTLPSLPAEAIDVPSGL